MLNNQILLSTEPLELILHPLVGQKWPCPHSLQVLHTWYLNTAINWSHSSPLTLGPIECLVGCSKESRIQLPAEHRKALLTQARYENVAWQ